MITLTRHHARCLRGIFRRQALGLARKGPVAPLVLRADGRYLHVQFHHDGIAVEHIVPSHRTDSGAVAIPIEALADFEGRDETPVTVEPAGPHTVRARWSDRGVPVSREYEAGDVGARPVFPAPPESWNESSPALLDALAEACAVAGEPSPRYALDCVQLRGGRGEIAATDGRQVLVQGGFALPWAGDLLIARRPVFARPELPRDDGVDVASAGDLVALRAGPWAIWLAVRSNVRFPDVDRAVPTASPAATRLRLHPGDAAFLADAIGRLPGGDDEDGPVTLDLDRHVVVRARGESGPAAELALARSSHSGPPVRVAMNRTYFARAAQLGFIEIDVPGVDAPLCGRDGRRVYAWQPLGEAAVVGPAEDTVRVESTAAEPSPAPPSIAATIPARREPSRSPSHATVTPRPTPAAGMPGLIEEAVALHATLGDARSRAARLVAALRAERRRSRTLAGALEQIRQLRLQDVAG